MSQTEGPKPRRCDGCLKKIEGDDIEEAYMTQENVFCNDDCRQEFIRQVEAQRQYKEELQ